MFLVGHNEADVSCKRLCITCVTHAPYIVCLMAMHASMQVCNHFTTASDRELSIMMMQAYMTSMHHGHTAERHESKGMDSPTPILRSQASEEPHAASHEVGSSTSDVLGGGLASLNGPGRRLVSNRLSRQSLSSNEGDGESLLQLGMHADPLAHSSSASLLRQSAAGISHSGMMGAPSSPLRGNSRYDHLNVVTGASEGLGYVRFRVEV